MIGTFAVCFMLAGCGHEHGLCGMAVPAVTGILILNERVFRWTASAKCSVTAAFQPRSDIYTIRLQNQRHTIS